MTTHPIKLAELELDDEPEDDDDGEGGTGNSKSPADPTSHTMTLVGSFLEHCGNQPLEESSW